MPVHCTRTRGEKSIKLQWLQTEKSFIAGDSKIDIVHTRDTFSSTVYGACENWKSFGSDVLFVGGCHLAYPSWLTSIQKFTYLLKSTRFQNKEEKQNIAPLKKGFGAGAVDWKLIWGLRFWWRKI